MHAHNIYKYTHLPTRIQIHTRVIACNAFATCLSYLFDSTHPKHIHLYIFTLTHTLLFARRGEKTRSCAQLRVPFTSHTIWNSDEKIAKRSVSSTSLFLTGSNTSRRTYIHADNFEHLVLAETRALIAIAPVMSTCVFTLTQPHAYIYIAYIYIQPYPHELTYTYRLCQAKNLIKIYVRWLLRQCLHVYLHIGLYTGVRGDAQDMLHPE